MVLGAMVPRLPAGGVGVSTLVIGMPHRSRLNLLTGLLHYPMEALLHKVPQGGGRGEGREGEGREEREREGREREMEGSEGGGE